MPISASKIKENSKILLEDRHNSALDMLIKVLDKIEHNGKNKIPVPHPAQDIKYLGASNLKELISNLIAIETSYLEKYIPETTKYFQFVIDHTHKGSYDSYYAKQQLQILSSKEKLFQLQLDFFKLISKEIAKFTTEQDSSLLENEALFAQIVNELHTELAEEQKLNAAKVIPKKNDILFPEIKAGKPIETLRELGPFSIAEDIGIRRPSQEDKYIVVEQEGKKTLEESYKALEKINQSIKETVKDINSGTTATMGYFNPETADLTFSNLGDSRIIQIVLNADNSVDADNTKRLTYDQEIGEGQFMLEQMVYHKGGIVSYEAGPARINGSLKCGGAYGDKEVGNVPNEAVYSHTNFSSLVNQGKQVFIVASCDGLFEGDCLTEFSAAQIASAFIKRSNPQEHEKLSEALLRSAIKNGSTDNVTSCVLDINSAIKNKNNSYSFAIFDGHGGDECAKVAQKAAKESMAQNLGKIVGDIEIKGIGHTIFRIDPKEASLPEVIPPKAPDGLPKIERKLDFAKSFNDLVQKYIKLGTQEPNNIENINSLSNLFNVLNRALYDPEYKKLLDVKDVSGITLNQNLQSKISVLPELKSKEIADQIHKAALEIKTTISSKFPEFMSNAAIMQKINQELDQIDKAKAPAQVADKVEQPVKPSNNPVKKDPAPAKQNTPAEKPKEITQPQISVSEPKEITQPQKPLIEPKNIPKKSSFLKKNLPYIITSAAFLGFAIGLPFIPGLAIGVAAAIGVISGIIAIASGAIAVKNFIDHRKDINNLVGKNVSNREQVLKPQDPDLSANPSQSVSHSHTSRVQEQQKGSDGIPL